jgi:hypothetical protein
LDNSYAFYSINKKIPVLIKNSIMTKKIYSTYSILIIFIFLQPIINSINGYLLNQGLPSFIGPFFYLAGLLVFFIISIKKKQKIMLLSLSTWLLIYIYHTFSELSLPNDIATYLKIVYPIVIFSVVKEMDLTSFKFHKIIRAINFSIYVYCILIIFSFIIDYKSRHGTGYFGFIDGNNDLTVLLLLWLSFALWLEKIGIQSKKEIIFISFIFTFSKAIILMTPSAVMFYLKKFRISYLILFGSLFAISLFFSNIIFERSLGKYYESELTQGTWLNWIHDEYFWRIITFGRSEYLITAYENGAFSWSNLILGNGVNGMKLYLNDKIGIEMDLFDAIAQNGLIGLLWLLLFYYAPLLRLNIGVRAKIAFIFVILYSLTGGHFFNNPLVGFYYGLYLGLVSNRTIRLYSN